MRHPKSIRRRFLQVLYEHYMADPLEMVPPEVFLDDGMERAQLIPNTYYLSDRGLIELMRGYNPHLFAGARITPQGIDLVENHYAFNTAFPPDPSEMEVGTAAIPLLLERLVEEVELSPLDGETRRALLRDVIYLRDEIARPVERWRRHVIDAALQWIDAYQDGCTEHFLPSCARIKEAMVRFE